MYVLSQAVLQSVIPRSFCFLLYTNITCIACIPVNLFIIVMYNKFISLIKNKHTRFSYHINDVWVHTLFV